MRRKSRQKSDKTDKFYDPSRKTPVIRCSICTGEQVAGFQDKETGAFEEIALIRSDRDLEKFKDDYGIRTSEELKKIY